MDTSVAPRVTLQMVLFGVRTDHFSSSSCSALVLRFAVWSFFIFQLHVSPSPARRTMEAQEWGASASPRGDHGTGTQGSPVGRRSRLVDVD